MTFYLALIQLDQHSLATHCPYLDIAHPVDTAQRQLEVGTDKQARIDGWLCETHIVNDDLNALLAPALRLKRNMGIDDIAYHQQRD